MAARKKKAKRKKKAARKGRGAGKSPRKKGARKKKKGADRKGKTGRAGGKAAGTAKAHPEQEGVRSWTAAVAERLTELVEHTAAGALRRAIDAGGREIGGWLPEASTMRMEAGAYLRELRELAGLTLDELADAVELRDRSLLEAVEAGTATISFELILRLAAILARHDPAPFVSRLVRSQNPVLWQVLEDWGVGRLPLQSVREREFVNVLRASDAARALSDEDFAAVLGFTRAAFETALHFARSSGTPQERPVSR